MQSVYAARRGSGSGVGRDALTARLVTPSFTDASKGRQFGPVNDSFSCELLTTKTFVSDKMTLHTIPGDALLSD